MIMKNVFRKQPSKNQFENLAGARRNKLGIDGSIKHIHSSINILLVSVNDGSKEDDGSSHHYGK